MKFVCKHSVLAAQTNSLWYKSASCVSSKRVKDSEVWTIRPTFWLDSQRSRDFSMRFRLPRTCRKVAESLDLGTQANSLCYKRGCPFRNLGYFKIVQSLVKRYVRHYS